MANRRGLRSEAIPTPDQPAIQPSPVSSPVSFSDVLSPQPARDAAIQIIRPETKLAGLAKEELKLLREKQTRLRSTANNTLSNLPPGAAAHIRNALESTLIFAQYEAGTAVCVDASGWILTCAHCFGDDEEEYRMANKRRWLLFYTGLAVQVECRFWDPQRDLALLKVVAIESDGAKIGDVPAFRFVALSENKPSYRMPILCIGQPGRDDLESTSALRTKYNLVEVSEGTFRGMARGADPQDNSEIGSLMHDAWTYWGHSGAPLIREADGTLVGLHSSWDDRTAMRHGIPVVAIREFLSEKLPNALAAVAGSQENPLDVG
jgi:S1-C subfamily serine protease